MSKFYFGSESDELCYTLKHFIENSTAKEVTLFEAVKVPISESGVFWCSEYGEAGMVGSGYESCGKSCPSYSPCNGKSGKCRFYTHTYKKGNLVTIQFTNNPAK